MISDQITVFFQFRETGNRIGCMTWITSVTFSSDSEENGVVFMMISGKERGEGWVFSSSNSESCR